MESIEKVYSPNDHKQQTLLFLAEQLFGLLCATNLYNISEHTFAAI